MNQLEVYFADDPGDLQGFRTVSCTEDCHPYGDKYWPAGHIIGYEHTFNRINCEDIISPVVPFEEAATAYETFVDREPARSIKLGVILSD